MNIQRNYKIKLLIVDDNSEDRCLSTRMLNQANGVGWTILEAETGDQGLNLCKIEKPDCVLLDYNLPDINGVEFMVRLKDMSISIPVVMLTDQGDEVIATSALREGVGSYLIKGAQTPDFLKRTILYCIKGNEGALKDLNINQGNKLSRPNWKKKKKAQLISEIQILKEKLESAIGIDPFTGLPNRKNMLDKLHYEKCRFERNKRPFSLIMADIDDYSAYDSKTANDLLAQVGELLNLNSRKQDVVSHWNRERFLLLLPETGLDGAAILIKKLCKKVETGEFPHPSGAEPITMSFKAGVYDDETIAIEECIEQADECLF